MSKLKNLNELILFHQVSSLTLNKGLYLGYLQAQSQVDSMGILVSRANPSLPPFMKIRDNPHVTADEWKWLSEVSSSPSMASPTTNFLMGEGEEGSSALMMGSTPTESQYAFGKDIWLSISRSVHTKSGDGRRDDVCFTSCLNLH